MECETTNTVSSLNLDDSKMVPESKIILQPRPQVITTLYAQPLGLRIVEPSSSSASENSYSSDNLCNTETGRVSWPDMLHLHPQTNFAEERIVPEVQKLGSDVNYISAGSSTEVSWLSLAKSWKEALEQQSESLKRRIQEFQKQRGTEITPLHKHSLGLMDSKTEMREESFAFLSAVLKLCVSHDEYLKLQTTKAKIHAKKIVLLLRKIEKLCLRVRGMEMRYSRKRYMKLLKSLYTKAIFHELYVGWLTDTIKNQVKILEEFHRGTAESAEPFETCVILMYSKAKTHEKEVEFQTRLVKRLKECLVKAIKEAKSKMRQRNRLDKLLEHFKAIQI